MLKTLFLLLFTSCSFAGTLRRVRESHNCECGIGNEGGHRHFGVGENVATEFAANHAWPWDAAIVNISDLIEGPVAYCGGSLINNQYIITAAHCIPDMKDSGVENFRIFLGTNFITTQFDEVFLDLGILEIKSHPKFDFDTADNDIALIKLSERVSFSKKVRPVCLKQPQGDDDEKLVGAKGIVTGWGSVNLTSPTEEELKEADALIVSREECARNYSTVEIPITETMMCASVLGQDPCKGDSGSSLIIKDSKNRYNQVGIVSHGEGCNVPSFPTIFSKLSVFIDWMVENTLDANYCRGTF